MANYRKGDVNMDGLINEDDLALVYAYINDTGTLTEEQITLADINEDGKVNIKDYNLIYNLIQEENKVYGYKNNGTKVEVLSDEDMTELETKVNKYLKDDGIYFADEPAIYESSSQEGMRMLDDSLRLSDTIMEQYLRTEKDGPGTYLDSAGIGAIVDSFSTAIHNLWNAIDSLDNAAILTSRVSVYFNDTHFDGRNFFAQKNGNLCTIWGIASPVADTPFQMETGIEYVIATLPEGYRPTSTLNQKVFSTLVLRDSGFVEIDQSTINVFPDGSVAIRQRCGETRTIGQILINMTFPIDA